MKTNVLATLRMGSSSARTLGASEQAATATGLPTARMAQTRMAVSVTRLTGSSSAATAGVSKPTGTVTMPTIVEITAMKLAVLVMSRLVAGSARAHQAVASQLPISVTWTTTVGTGRTRKDVLVKATVHSPVTGVDASEAS